MSQALVSVAGAIVVLVVIGAVFFFRRKSSNHTNGLGGDANTNNAEVQQEVKIGITNLRKEGRVGFASGVDANDYFCEGVCEGSFYPSLLANVMSSQKFTLSSTSPAEIVASWQFTFPQSLDMQLEGHHGKGFRKSPAHGSAVADIVFSLQAVYENVGQPPLVP